MNSNQSNELATPKYIMARKVRQAFSIERYAELDSMYKTFGIYNEQLSQSVSMSVSSALHRELRNEIT